jgi:hypothetical protein
VVALGAEKVAEMTGALLTDEQRAAFAVLGEIDAARGLAMLGIVQLMQRDEMTPATQAYLAEHFVLGWVDIEVNGEWREVDSFEALDAELDGANDAQVWTDLIWHQIPFCLGPTIGAAGTGADTSPTGQTPSR